MPIALQRAKAEEKEYKPHLLMIQQRGATEVVNQSDILYIERSGRISYVHAAGGRVMQSPDKLNALLDEIEPGTFGRCHVSYLVNYSQVEHLGRDTVRLKDGSAVPVSRAYARPFRQGLGEYIARCTAQNLD